MSKSKFNGISPIETLDKYGADNLRLTIFFHGPIEKDLIWDNNLHLTIV